MTNGLHPFPLTIALAVCTHLSIASCPSDGALLKESFRAHNDQGLEENKGQVRTSDGRPAPQVHDHIRALSPAPGAWCEVNIAGKAERLKVLRTVEIADKGEAGMIIDGKLTVACGTEAVRLVEVQRAGGRVASAEEFLRGVKLEKGMTVL